MNFGGRSVCKGGLIVPLEPFEGLPPFNKFAKLTLLVAGAMLGFKIRK
jgi:hypothetical protein